MTPDDIPQEYRIKSAELRAKNPDSKLIGTFWSTYKDDIFMITHKEDSEVWPVRAEPVHVHVMPECFRGSTKENIHAGHPILCAFKNPYTELTPVRYDILVRPCEVREPTLLERLEAADPKDYLTIMLKDTSI